MSQKSIFLKGVGEIVVRKRKGAKNIKLSVSGGGKISISIPWWASYGHALRFAERNHVWISGQLQKVEHTEIYNGARVGKNHQVSYTHTPNLPKPSSRVSNNIIKINAPWSIDSLEAQELINKASEKALKIETLQLLTPRLDALAKEHGFTYKEMKVKKLKSRWGSCSSDKTITLNFYLVQLPWNLIDYVLLHELTHTKQMNHGPNFWNELERVCPNAKHWRKILRQQSNNIIPG